MNKTNNIKYIFDILIIFIDYNILFFYRFIYYIYEKKSISFFITI